MSFLSPSGIFKMLTSVNIQEMLDILNNKNSISFPHKNKA